MLVTERAFEVPLELGKLATWMGCWLLEDEQAVDRPVNACGNLVLLGVGGDHGGVTGT